MPLSTCLTYTAILTYYSLSNDTGAAGAAGEAEAELPQGPGKGPAARRRSQHRGWLAASGPIVRHRHRSLVSLSQQLCKSRANSSAAELRLCGSAGRDGLCKLINIQRLELRKRPGHVLKPRTSGCQFGEQSAKQMSLLRASGRIRHVATNRASNRRVGRTRRDTKSLPLESRTSKHPLRGCIALCPQNISGVPRVRTVQDRGLLRSAP